MHRLPAEWEKSGAVLIAWPHEATDWGYMLEEVCECYVNVLRQITRRCKAIIATAEPDVVMDRIAKAGIDTGMVAVAAVPTNDTWARDFGPITMVDDENRPTLVDFKFNGWGLKFASDKDNLITRHLLEQGVIKGGYVNKLNFVLEGGSIESNGRGTLLTTSECLLSPNRNGEFNRGEIESYLKETLCVDNVLWLDHGALAGDDTDSHVDTLARLAPDNGIVYVKCHDREDEHFAELEAMERQLRGFSDETGAGFKLYPVPLPRAIFDEDGERLPATYANFLILNGTVIVPTYNQEDNDREALAVIGEAFKGYEVVGVDCNALIKQHGSLHCITMQMVGQE